MYGIYEIYALYLIPHMGPWAHMGPGPWAHMGPGNFFTGPTMVHKSKGTRPYVHAHVYMYMYMYMYMSEVGGSETNREIVSFRSCVRALWL